MKKVAYLFTGLIFSILFFDTLFTKKSNDLRFYFIFQCKWVNLLFFFFLSFFFLKKITFKKFKKMKELSLNESINIFGGEVQPAEGSYSLGYAIGTCIRLMCSSAAHGWGLFN